MAHPVNNFDQDDRSRNSEDLRAVTQECVAWYIVGHQI